MAGLTDITKNGTQYEFMPRSTAGQFSTSTAYAVGDYCYFDGTLYRCTTAHAAGAFVASHFTAVTIDGELKAKESEIENVKSDLSDVESVTLDTNLFDKTLAIDNARIGTNGAVVDPANGYFASDWISVESATTYIKNSDKEDAYHRVAFYNVAKDFISATTDNVFTTTSLTKYVRFCGESAEKDTALLSKATAKDDISRFAIQSLPYVGFCPTLRNGTAQETGNSQQVCVSQIIPYDKADSIVILINKPVSASGNYWRVVFTTYSVDTGKPEDNNANRVTFAVAIDSTKITINKDTFDHSSVGFAFALAEKNAQGSVVPHRITDFVANDVVVIKNYIPDDKSKGAYEYEGQKITLKNKLDCLLYMKLSKPSGISQTYQGLAVYDNTMLQGFDGGYWGMYDLTANSQTAFASGQVEGATSTLHFNSCCFGAKYNSNDTYPLLYSTGGVIGTLNPSGVDDHSYCVVHRFVEEGGVLTAKLIQHIYVDMSSFESSGLHSNYGGGSFLVEGNYLYVFSALYRTNGSQEAYDDVNKYVVHQYKVPSTSEEVVTLTAEDVINEYLFDYDTWYMQGGTINEGIIYHAFGGGGEISGASSKPKNNAIRAYNVVGGFETAKIDGTILPYASLEPEGLAVYDGKLLANTNDGSIYALDFH